MKELAAGMVLVGLLGCGSNQAAGPSGGDAGTTTFKQASDATLAMMQKLFYEDGNWELCVPNACSLVASADFDWGADSLTAALYLRWSLEQDPSIPPMMQALDANGVAYGSCTAQSCPSWSDVPLWDSIAASHEYLVTRQSHALTRAQAAFNYVDTATEFALGACPEIAFQVPVQGSVFGSAGPLKTLETDSNYIKAALLLYQITGTKQYLDKAVARYASVRKYFLDPAVPLYTVYVLDDGRSCAQIARRFYGSVNGNMIWNGVALEAATGTGSYLDDAIATGQAVSQLADANGVYADLQTDDDVVEPLIEGMYELAAKKGQDFARQWLLTSAEAMAGARTADGAYGRFFDGPPPPAQITAWQANGGLALAFVAGALSPDGDASAKAGAWSDARDVADDLPDLPSSIQFTGQAIAVFGTLADGDYQLGQATVLVDGVQTFDQTGIHQNQSNAFGPVPDSILFAWRWPTSGSHTLSFAAGPSDPKNGGPFLHVQHYAYVP